LVDLDADQRVRADVGDAAAVAEGEERPGVEAVALGQQLVVREHDELLGCARTAQALPFVSSEGEAITR
jgi:hypothetical protein